MKLQGNSLVALLRATTGLVKLIGEDGQVIGKLTSAQALLVVEADPRYHGGGSNHRVRYIQATKQEMTASQQSFAKAHDLPRYDPTYFRTFAGYPSGRTSLARRKK